MSQEHSRPLSPPQLQAPPPEDQGEAEGSDVIMAQSTSPPPPPSPPQPKHHSGSHLLPSRPLSPLPGSYIPPGLYLDPSEAPKMGDSTAQPSSSEALPSRNHFSRKIERHRPPIMPQKIVPAPETPPSTRPDGGLDIRDFSGNRFLSDLPLDDSPPLMKYQNFIAPLLRRFPQHDQRINFRKRLGQGLEGVVYRVWFGSGPPQFALKIVSRILQVLLLTSKRRWCLFTL